MMLAVVQKEIEMELVTQKKNVVKEMGFKWEHALKDMGFAVLVSKLIAFCQSISIIVSYFLKLHSVVVTRLQTTVRT